ncbi:hypothetical protein LINGRAPRIM_LOCUS2697 [Linum grandiflorum]
MDNLGVPGYRKTMRSRRTLDGWEVSQLHAEDEPAIDDEPSLGNDHSHFLHADPRVHEEESVQPNMEVHSLGGLDADKEDDNEPLSPHSNYRGSSESDHLGRNNSDEEAESTTRDNRGTTLTMTIKH